MTRARALKTAIRTRALKTGERYTTARRHVLKALKFKVGDAEGLPRHKQGLPPRDEGFPRQAAVGAVSAKGSVSDAKSREKTGHGLDHWFGVLDRFGAVEKGHTAAARHLYDVHGVDGWYAQGITVAYERARGVRTVNQRCDGEYEVSASKVVTAETPRVIAALSQKRQRVKWAAAADQALVAALAAALDAPSSKGFIVRPDGQARVRYKWDGTTVELRLTPKPGGKTSLVVQHMKLPSADSVETRRAEWRAAFQAIADRSLRSRGDRR
jgi:hypothetical protein